MKHVITAAALICLTTGAAVAEEGSTSLELAQHIFTHADVDNDGVLTATEHSAAGLGRYGASFSDFDLDQDSKVTWDEYRTVFERYHKATEDQPV